MSVLGAEFGTGQVFWSMLYFFAFVIWIWLALSVFGDIFRSDDLSGWGKAWWTLLVVVVPYFGVLVYLIARGGKMHEHAARAAQAHDEAARAYVKSAAGSGPSAADQVTQLASLKADGVIDESEFQQLKQKATAI